MDRPKTKPPSPTSTSAYSSPSTQFIALSDDDINLWQAVAIVDERPTAFKVKWADSWVAKCDVTPDMVDVWRVGHASVRSDSTLSRRKSRNKSKFSTATATSTVTKPRGFSESSTISNPNPKGKEEKVVSDSEDEKDIDEITTILLPTSTVARPSFNTEYVLIQSDKNYKQKPDIRPRGDNSSHNALSMGVDETILNAQRGLSHKTPASAASHVPHNSHNPHAPTIVIPIPGSDQSDDSDDDNNSHDEEKEKEKERGDDDDDEENGNDAGDESRPAVTPNSIVVTPVWKDGKIVRETFKYLESEAEFDKRIEEERKASIAESIAWRNFLLEHTKQKLRENPTKGIQDHSKRRLLLFKRVEDILDNYCQPDDTIPDKMLFFTAEDLEKLEKITDCLDEEPKDEDVEMED
ncbi:hypothetical protein F5876DRAFT_82710 [Lentinula aff. lateritia]|uniref:Uncharacterized protein n=1 Tax=Lentinula aff. lateritia TaxID=2804960 RepID=A0ACC1TJC1_9AGAR|nr:hypothetical protein F5876DRAFT_82710 [Lentinula aff. lateritia]